MMMVQGASKSGSFIRLLKRPVVVLLVFVATYFSYEYIANRQITPPDTECTLSELADKLPPPVRLVVVEQNAVQRLVWIGTIPRFTIRSGPPCYILDEHGRLVDWCAETGEGWRSDDIVTAAYEGQPISLDTALRWCKGHGNSTAISARH